MTHPRPQPDRTETRDIDLRHTNAGAAPPLGDTCTGCGVLLDPDGACRNRAAGCSHAVAVVIPIRR